MKKLLLICLVLAGCTGEYIHPDDYKSADKLCAPNGGVDYIFVGSNTLNIRCVNGAIFPSESKYPK